MAYGQQPGYQQQQPLPTHAASGQLLMRCPHCGSLGPHLVDEKVATGGWVLLVVLLFLCFPLFWIGLCIKERHTICGYCRVQLR
jgi:hypothetical protein